MNDMNALNEEFSRPVQGQSILAQGRNKIIMGTAAFALLGLVCW